MRMHKKSHLEERLAACSDIAIFADLTQKNMLLSAENKTYLNFKQLFGNDNPVHLEVGCGKGKFALEMAQAHPDVNFIAVERISNVILEGCEKCKELGIPNVRFLNCAAEVLGKYFEDSSVQRMYLNFSNPLPKQGYVRQRLTNPRFLKIYSALLEPNAELWQKTDDKDFYLYSLESYGEAGYTVVETCEDLKNNPFAGNVVTEHEQKFMDMGLPIFRIVAKNNK